MSPGIIYHAVEHIIQGVDNRRRAYIQGRVSWVVAAVPARVASQGRSQPYFIVAVRAIVVYKSIKVLADSLRIKDGPQAPGRFTRQSVLSRLFDRIPAHPSSRAGAVIPIAVVKQIRLVIVELGGEPERIGLRQQAGGAEEFPEGAFEASPRVLKKPPSANNL